MISNYSGDAFQFDCVWIDWKENFDPHPDLADHVGGGLGDEGQGGEPLVGLHAGHVTVHHQVPDEADGGCGADHGNGIQEELPVKRKQ